MFELFDSLRMNDLRLGQDPGTTSESGSDSAHHLTLKWYQLEVVILLQISYWVAYKWRHTIYSPSRSLAFYK